MATEPRNRAHRERAAGFTLLEVMVALTVVALGMMAAFTTVTQSASTAVYLRDKTVANWIAMNRIAEMRLEPVWPDEGDSDGEVELAGQVWTWTAEVSATPVENLRRVDVTVSLGDGGEDRTLVTLVGFIGQPLPPGASRSWTGGGPGGTEQEEQEEPGTSR